MKTIELSKQMKSYLTSAKVFAAKKVSRPVLTASLVNLEYVIATDSHRLIRIKHNEEIQESFLYHYKEGFEALSSSSYPDISRIIPRTLDSQLDFTINVKEWLIGHENGLIAAKEHDNLNIMLQGHQLNVNPLLYKKGKYNKKERAYEKISVPLHEQISYHFALSETTGIEKVTYNCKYMIEALKVFKKFKHTEVKFHFYGMHRPFLMVAGNIEILILPIRIN